MHQDQATDVAGDPRGPHPLTPLPLRLERRALQLVILLGGCVPVCAGALGVWRGGGALHVTAGPGADSHIRYLSGLLLAIGLMFWGCAPAVERRGAVIRLLTILVVVGGLARLGGWLFVGDPGGMRWALVMELGVTPLICLWQARVAHRLTAGDYTVDKRKRESMASPDMHTNK
jgi:hypothetical protein